MVSLPTLTEAERFPTTSSADQRNAGAVPIARPEAGSGVSGTEELTGVDGDLDTGDVARLI